MKTLAVIGALGALSSICSGIGTFFGVAVAKQIMLYSTLIAAVAFVLLAWQAGFAHASLLSLASVEDLHLDDDCGKSARWISTRRIMTCYGAINGLNTTADVTGDEPAITSSLDGQDLEVTLEPRRGTQTAVRIAFPGTLRRFKWHTLWMESTYRDTYTGSKERAFLTIFHPALRLKMCVHFPKNRPPKNARMLIEYGGASRDYGPLPVENDSATGGKMVCWAGWFAAPGQAYRIEWQW